MVEYKKKIINLKGGGSRTLYYKEYKNGGNKRVNKEEAIKKGGFSLFKQKEKGATCEDLEDQEKQACALENRLTVRFFEKGKNGQVNGLTAKDEKCCINLKSITINKNTAIKLGTQGLNIRKLSENNEPIIYDDATIKIKGEKANKYVAKLEIPGEASPELKTKYRAPRYNNSGDKINNNNDD